VYLPGGFAAGAVLGPSGVADFEGEAGGEDEFVAGVGFHELGEAETEVGGGQGGGVYELHDATCLCASLAAWSAADWAMSRSACRPTAS
jgi:hypothetical protein